MKRIVGILIVMLLIVSALPVMNAENEFKYQEIIKKATNEKVISNMGYTQPPGIQWEKTYGSSGLDAFRSVQQTSDGGYIAAGVWNEEAHWLVKVDSNGNEEWNITALHTSELYPRAYFVEETSDGGFIVCGCHDDWPTGYNRFLWKVKNNGETEWVKTYDDPEIGFFTCAHQTDDDSIIVTGHVGEQDIILMKTDMQGNKIWEKTYDVEGYDYAWAVRQTDDNGFVIAGYTYTEDEHYDVVLIKTNEYGTKQWVKTYGGIKDEIYRSKDIALTDDGGYLLSARGSTYGAGRDDLWIIKTDNEGNMEWNETYGEGGYDSPGGMDMAKDNGYIFALTKNLGAYTGTKDDGWIIKTDDEGNVCWSQIFGGNKADQIQSVRTTSDGGYILAGCTESCPDCDGEDNAWLIKLEPDSEMTPPELILKKPKPGWIYIWDVFAFPIFVVDEAIIYDRLTFNVKANHESGIAKVEYFIDDQLIGDATEPPFEYMWDSDDVGLYRLKIRAYNNYGGTIQKDLILDKRS
ncbi:MAG: Ig-like domain-containing protein [Thermoplasmatota archaeon]